jgi:YD repeat-containing protein
MVAIVGGAELGLLTGSGSVLGGAGQVGSSPQGRSQEGVLVNAVTGNLVIQRQDEYLAGRGPDVGVLRTYNSLGLLNDDNGDNWRLGYSRKVYGLTGGSGVNTAGSTVKRLGEDGADVTYTYDATQSAYITDKGNGAHDLLTFSSSTNKWTWTEGSSQIKEVYDNAASGRLAEVLDPDGNKLTLGYNTAGLVNSIASANGETTYIDYDTATGKTTNITQIRTVNSSSATLTRVRYGYDTSNRLSTVTVDLSPSDNVIADNKTYITTYTYDGSSKRVATLTQSDGSQLQFTYVQVGADYRIQTVKDVRGSDIRTTQFAYDTTNRKTVARHALVIR